MSGIFEMVRHTQNLIRHHQVLQLIVLISCVEAGAILNMAYPPGINELLLAVWIGSDSFVPRPLKTWEWPGDEAMVLMDK